MIVCFNCKHSNMDGAIFCEECGSQLGKESVITKSISTQKFDRTSTQTSRNESFQSFDDSTAWGSLHLMDTGQVLPLSTRNEFTIGRASEGQPNLPDIDLSSYQAYAAGVSRLHGVIKRDGNHILFTDLGSANGTYINGKRLAANAEQAINNGDIISLGKLKLQIMIKTAEGK